jgi:hypothetical protein
VQGLSGACLRELELRSTGSESHWDMDMSDVMCTWRLLVGWYSDWLRTERPGDRIPVGGDFSTPVQTGPGSHPASLYNGYRVLPGGKAAGAWR